MTQYAEHHLKRDKEYRAFERERTEQQPTRCECFLCGQVREGTFAETKAWFRGHDCEAKAA